MKTLTKGLIILPTYNEADNIRTMIERILEVAPASVHILVVDDSSPDGTGALVKRLTQVETRVNLLVRKQKEGLALAYLAGFQWGIDQGYEFLVEMDADGSHDPKYLPTIFELIQSHDVVIGCRYTQGGGTEGWSWLRQLISRGGNIYAQTILGLKIRDLTGGFNAWRAETLKEMPLAAIRSRGYAFQVELKYRAFLASRRLVEFPIVFLNRQLGVSKMTGNIVWEAAIRVPQLRHLLSSRIS